MTNRRVDLTKSTPAGEIEQYIRSKLNPTRYAHVLSVRDLAVDLAEKYGADVHSVNLAALLHDCAKWMRPAELYEAAGGYGIQLDEIESRNASLLHAIIGAEIAIFRFAIDDAEILDGVRTHTTGRAKMTLMEKILYVADFAEPRRTHEGVDRVRALAYQDLDRAAFEVSRYKIEHLLKKGAPIHPNTIDAYNSALRRLSRNADGERW